MTDTRPVLLGMNNPLSDDPRYALFPHPTNSAGARLQRMSGLTRSQYLGAFDRRNVVGGQQWTPALGRAAAPALRDELRGRTVVLLGAEVASLMRGGTEHELAGHFEWRPDGAGGWMARVPHPSGRSTFYNEPLHRELLRVFLEELVA